MSKLEVFLWVIYCKHEQKKYIISYKTSLGYDIQYNVNARIILLDYICLFLLIFVN